MRWSSVTDWPLPVPLQFLVRFAVVAGMLFLFRERLAELYLSTMVPTVNGLFNLEELGVVYRQQRHVLLLVYEELGFHFRVHDIIYQNVMVTIALFAATPGYSLRWRAGWTAVVLALLWLTHAASLYMGGYVIIWDYLESLGAGERQDLARQIGDAFPRDRDWLFSHLFGLWHTWGRPTLALLIWLFAARRFLRLSTTREEG